MKRFFSALFLALSAVVVSAQTLTVSQGSVNTVFAAEDVATISVTDGSILTIGGVDYAASQTDSIVVDEREVPTASVEVAWTDDGPKVTIAGDVAPWVSVTVSGNHVTAVADETLEQEVSYTLSGTAQNASFTQQGSYKCTLVLNNLNLTSNSGPALNIMNGKRINVVLPEGTVNSLTDAAGGTHKAACYMKGHAEWSGAGSLTLRGLTKHAYASEEYTQLKKDFGKLTVTEAVGDGLHIEQYYEQRAGTVSISGCAGDGIDCEPTNDPTEELNGQVLIHGGVLNVNIGSVGDVKALKCDSLMTITGGTLTLTGTGDGQKGIKTGTDLLVQQATDSSLSITIRMSGGVYHSGQVDESKTRGIKVDGDFTFNGGTINVTTGGQKAKDVVVDGLYTKVSGTMNATVYN